MYSERERELETGKVGVAYMAGYGQCGQSGLPSVILSVSHNAIICTLGILYAALYYFVFYLFLFLFSFCMFP